MDQQTIHQRTFQSLAQPPEPRQLPPEQRQLPFARETQRELVRAAFRKRGICGLTCSQRKQLFLLFDGLIGCPEPATQEKLRDRMYAGSVSTVSETGALAESLKLLTREPAVGGLHHRANWDALATLGRQSGFFLANDASQGESRFDVRSATSGQHRTGDRPSEKTFDSAQGQSGAVVPQDESRPRDGVRPPAARDSARQMQTLTLESKFTSPPNPRTLLGNSLSQPLDPSGPQPIAALVVPALHQAAGQLADPRRREAEMLAAMQDALVTDVEWDGVQPKTRINIARAAIMGQNSDGARGISPADWTSVLATCRRGWKINAAGERELLRSRRAYMLRSFDEAARRNGLRLHRQKPTTEGTL